MPSVRDSLSKLKVAVVGTKTAELDKKLDQAVKDIISYRSSSNQLSYIDLVKNIISKEVSSTSLNGLLGGVDAGHTSPALFGQGNRIARYKTYQSIIKNIDFCRRALSVLTDNILSPDDITKTSLDISPISYHEEETNAQANVKNIKELISKVKLEENLDLIVMNTLGMGDFFCEIADAKTTFTSQAMLYEWIGDIRNENNNNIDQFESLVEFEQIKSEKKKYNNFKIRFEINYSLLEDEENSEGKKYNIEQLNLLFHEPNRVIKLQSDLYPVCFGYLVFPKAAINPQHMIKDQAINNICNNIIRSLKDRIPQIDEVSDLGEIKHIIKSIAQQADPNKIMKIRFVPPDKMQHFKRPSTEFYPYGESIFEGSKYSAKVLIALETALAIQRLSRSTEKRKIGIEIGLPRDASKMVEAMKESFRKRKVTLDSFETIDTIPSMIGTFEDIYVPQRDGKPFVDVSTFTEGNVDTRSKVDELKYVRDALVAGFGVPPAIIGIEENSTVKSTLAEENLLFARTIIGHQKYLTHQVNELIQKIYKLVEPEKALEMFDNIKIAFPVPKSLQFERESKYISDLANLVRSLEDIGIPKEWAKKQYLQNIDWIDLENFETKEKIDKTTGEEKEEEGMGGGYM